MTRHESDDSDDEWMEDGASSSCGDTDSEFEIFPTSSKGRKRTRLQSTAIISKPDDGTSITHTTTATTNDADAGVTALKPHACPESGCARRYAKVGKLNRHILTHRGTRAHHCSHIGCNRAFARSDHLRRHERTHDILAVRPHHCHHMDCDRGFMTSTHLKRHMASHGVAVYECRHAGCDAKFVKRVQLRTHVAAQHAPPSSLPSPVVAVPSGASPLSESTAQLSLSPSPACESPSPHAECQQQSQPQPPAVQAFVCSFLPCTESFATRPLLTKHVHLHHTPHRFVCSHCQAEFSRFLLWKRHCHEHRTDTAATDARHECRHAGCGKSFSSNSNLRVHVRVVHEKQRPHECPHCQRTFSYKHTWQQHIRTKHQQPETDRSRTTLKDKAFGRSRAGNQSKRRRLMVDEDNSNDDGNVTADESFADGAADPVNRSTVT